MAAKSETPKVRNPHPLMQQGTPPLDIEFDHISLFTIFRLGGGGPPVHVETIRPVDATEPGDIHRLVGGGRYMVRALANGSTSGKSDRSSLGATNFEWDGSPHVKSAPPSPQSAQPIASPSIVEQASQHGPAIVGAIGTALTGFMQILSAQREARAAEEQRRRDYDEARRREEREERERRDAEVRREAEERRDAERVAADERRERERQAADERRESDRKWEEMRLAAQRDEATARQRREDMLLQKLMSPPPAKTDMSETIMSTLIQRALNPPVVAPAGPNVDQILDAAKKLKDLNDGSSVDMIAALAPLAGTPVGQIMMAKIGSIANLCPPPEQMMGQPPPAQVEQQAEPLPQIPPEQPPVALQQQSAPGPVTIVN